MQYTTHYNLNLPEGTDIVNPLIQDNPNYTAIDTALYDNKLRVIGNATHVKTGTNHAITLADSDILAFKFVATGDYATGDTFTVDGVTVTARVADGSTIPNGAFKINSTVLAVLDGTILNLINVEGAVKAESVAFNNGSDLETVMMSHSVIGSGVNLLDYDASTPYITQGFAMVKTYAYRSTLVISTHIVGSNTTIDFAMTGQENSSRTEMFMLPPNTKVYADTTESTGVNSILYELN